MKKRGINTGLIILIIVLAAIFIGFVSCTIALFSEKHVSGNVALIPVKGAISVEGSGFFGADSASSSEIMEYIDDADSDYSIKAIVLEINSPGGSAVASKEIASAVMRAEKPVYAVIREIGASGGYWIASACDTIIANELSITGSVGVISSYLQFEGLLNRYNITYERLVSGKYKDMGTPFRQLTDDERMILNSKINKIHEMFVNEVSANRNLSQASIQRISSAEFFLGSEALELGLVDYLGDMKTAEELIKSGLGLKEIEFARYKKPLGFLESIAGVFSYNSFYMGKGIGSMIFDLNQNQYNIMI